MAFDQGWAALLGALIGGVGTYLATARAAENSIREASRNALVGAATEIEATIRIIEQRGWRADIELWRKAAIENRINGALSIHLPDVILPFAKAAMSKDIRIPVLEAKALAMFLVCVEGFASDVRRLAEHGADGPHSLVHHGDPSAAAELYGEMLVLFDGAVQHGRAFVASVEQRYPQ